MADPGVHGRRPVVLVNHLSEAPGRITGITRYTFGLLEAMIERQDTAIVLVTTWPKSMLPPKIASGVAGLETLRYIGSTPLNYQRQRFQVGRIARKHRADVVYAMNALCPPIRGIPSVITVHDLYYEVLATLYRRRYSVWWKLFFKRAARRAARIAVVSESTAADTAHRHPSLRPKLNVVAGAGLLPRGDAVLPVEFAESPYVLLLGNVAPNKNLAFAVGALRLLAERGTRVRALHVGRDLTGDLANAVAGDGGELLQPLGVLDDATLDVLLCNAVALVQPSRYEGFGLPIIEAHERGVPVIASDIDVFREVMGSGGILVGLDDVPQLAAALHSITSDQRLRSTLSARASANSARFSWEKSAASAVAMINQVCRAPR